MVWGHGRRRYEEGIAAAGERKSTQKKRTYTSKEKARMLLNNPRKFFKLFVGMETHRQESDGAPPKD
ncbi:hypothetical protein NECAME_08379 [Necator americanus]|uniref:Uncharacterized protein n=1 Tax=Necator americanus TaxID=51031 RepID=W2TJ66_NECAM|nr:hypothetical protein NECAME_08379 [Necator americanus]ETN81634.1 hypothetical protein NECAME_08379 [Necator americanus]